MTDEAQIEIALRDTRIERLEELMAGLAKRIDDLEAENARLKQHVRDLTAEAA